jgi:circadian clock protein KaiB
VQEPDINHTDFNLDSGQPFYVLRLFIIGASQNSVRAINNIKYICEMHLKDRYELEIIDLYQQPLKAKAEQIIALPLLVKISPTPERKFIGDLSDTEKVLKGLGVGQY